MNRPHGWVALAFVLVASFEGLRTSAYQDLVGIPTICYGETRGVNWGDTKTKVECDAMLTDALEIYAEGIGKCLKVEIPDTRKAVYVSLAYNIGTAAFCKSSVVRHANNQDVVSSCNAILLYNKAGGKVVNGLTNRRNKERELCMAGAS